MKLIQPPIKFYSQAEANWRDIILGKLRIIQSSGCALTSLAMLCNYLMKDTEWFTDPKWLDKYLDQISGYYNDLIIWDKAIGYLKIFGVDKYNNFLDIRKPSDIDIQIKSQIDNNIPVIGGVRYKTKGTNQNHWVLICGYHTELQGIYPMLDPATKIRKLLYPKYR